MNEGILDTAKDIWEYSSKLNENVYKFTDNNFKNYGYNITEGNSGGPLVNQGIDPKSFREYYNEPWFVLMVGFNINHSKSIGIRLQPTFDHEFQFKTCPFFYKLYKGISFIIDISGVRTTQSLEKRISENFPDLITTVEQAKKQFITDFNELVAGAENTRGYSCIFDTKDKKQMLSKILNSENLNQIYKLTGDESFLSQEAKDMFLF